MAGVRLGSELLVLVYWFDGTHVQKKKSNNGKVNPIISQRNQVLDWATWAISEPDHSPENVPPPPWQNILIC